MVVPRVLSEGDPIDWPVAPAGFLASEDLVGVAEPWGQVAVDGLPLIVLGSEALSVVPPDGSSPTRVYADDRGSVRCFSACVAAAGGAFLVRDRDGVLVARDITSLAVRWEHPAPEGTTGVYGDDDVFVVAFAEGLVAFDAATGETRWRSAERAAYGARIGQGLFVVPGDGAVLALGLDTGEPRFRLEAQGEAPGPVTPFGFAMVRADHARSVRQVRLVDLSGTEHVVELDADVESSDAVLVGADTLTVLVAISGERAEVRRYDVRTGRRSERSRPFGRAMPGTLLALGPDVVVVDRTLGIRLLDGALVERWFGGESGACVEPVIWRPTASVAPVLACRGYGGFAVYRASSEDSVRRRVIVTGTVRCGGTAASGHVMLEGTVARVDGRGRYRVAVPVDATADVTFVAETDVLDADCSGVRSVPVEADARTVDVDFDLEWRNIAEGL